MRCYCHSAKYFKCESALIILVSRCSLVGAVHSVVGIALKLGIWNCKEVVEEELKKEKNEPCRHICAAMRMPMTIPMCYIVV